MLSGSYAFNTEVKKIIARELELLLPDTGQWKVVKMGGVFDVPGSSVFKVYVKTPVDCCCSYL